MLSRLSRHAVARGRAGVHTSSADKEVSDLTPSHLVGAPLTLAYDNPVASQAGAWGEEV